MTDLMYIPLGRTVGELGELLENIERTVELSEGFFTLKRVQFCSLLSLRGPKAMLLVVLTVRA